MQIFASAEPRFGKDLIEILPSPSVRLDLRYATTDNFMKTNLYHGFQRAFLHKLAFDKFTKAKQALEIQQPGLQFVIFDSLRPRKVQQQMWDFLANTPYQSYVANPGPGSLHNFGLALDLSLGHQQGPELDMGTGFDDFSDLSQPQLEGQYLKNGKLSKEQLKNRELLRGLMLDAGFELIPNEWWHFNAISKSQSKSDFQIVE